MRRLFAVAVLGWCAASLAQPATSPVGLWRTVDDETGKARALVRITDVEGKLSGRIEKIFSAPGEDPNPKCEKCGGERKDQPVIGMVIMWDHGKDPDALRWGGGSVLDPENGKTYRGRIELIDGGKRLSLRGYVGIPVFGRTQEWVREE